MNRLKALIEEAGRLGVRVHMAELAGDLRGLYAHRQRIIAVRLGLTKAQMRETLAHELGHAYYGHECSGIPAIDQERERQADRRGALLLVDPDLYMQAEAVNAHPNHIAAELEVTPHVIEVWRSWWLPQILGRRRQVASQRK